jgi:hypothetical protein
MAGRVATLTVPDGTEITASLGGPKHGLPLPKIIAEGGRNPQPSLALGYTTSPDSASPNENQIRSALPQHGGTKTETAKPLSESAIEATHIALSGKTTNFSGSDDLSPPSGKFSTKTAAACAAGKSGQPCMPRAAR